MALELKKAIPVRLQSLELDERWLQDRIADDPSLLNLGDLRIIRRERNQPSGGRIDFLMEDPDRDLRYEVEIMLGELDESHIIRTIEYWDIEQQRYPEYGHRAVIVAEEITGRFFNIIRLLNRSVPIIALQLHAFQFGDSVVLQFAKVIDVYERSDDEDGEQGETANRHYWEKHADAESMAIVDQVIAMAPASHGQVRVTYNRFHIALGTSGYQFCWFYPRRSPSCYMEIKTGAEVREAMLPRLAAEGLNAKPYQNGSLKVKLTPKELRQSGPLIREVIEKAEEWSRTRGK